MTTETPTSTAIAHQERPTPKTMVTQYQQSFAAVLPSHITRPETGINFTHITLKNNNQFSNHTGLTKLQFTT